MSRFLLFSFPWKVFRPDPFSCLADNLGVVADCSQGRIGYTLAADRECLFLLRIARRVGSDTLQNHSGENC